jgi:hypothetical protein
MAPPDSADGIAKSKNAQSPLFTLYCAIANGGAKRDNEGRRA